ncbi:MAG TPA: SgcJ/EcaC family oxidoreductase [Chloroflexia bacterium]
MLVEDDRSRASTAAKPAGMPARDDEQAIRDIARSLEEAWNSGNGQAFAAPFAEDSDYVIVDGRHIKGRIANAEGHQFIFDTIYRGSTNSMSVESVRFIRPDVALAHVRHHVKFNRDGRPAEGHARSTLVVTKNDGEWSIAAFHNTPIQPHAGSNG